jgi:hypothetical protein
MAELELPTLTSEIALKITARRLEVPITELSGHNDRVRSRVHTRLQELAEVNAVEKRGFRANDRIHLYDLPKKQGDAALASRDFREQEAKERAEAL